MVHILDLILTYSYLIQQCWEDKQCLKQHSVGEQKRQSSESACLPPMWFIIYSSIPGPGHICGSSLLLALFTTNYLYFSSLLLLSKDWPSFQLEVLWAKFLNQSIIFSAMVCCFCMCRVKYEAWTDQKVWATLCAWQSLISVPPILQMCGGCQFFFNLCPFLI